MRKKFRQPSAKTYKIILFALIFIGLTGVPKASAFYQDVQEQEMDYKQYKGEIMDADTKKPLVFATLSVDNTNISIISNTDGEFVLKVPTSMETGNVTVAFLGYRNKTIPLSEFKEDKNKIYMDVYVEALSEVSLSIPKDAEQLVRETLNRKGQNYFNDPTLMTAFYRETIKKRKKNVSLSEAVVNIYKSPYNSNKKDGMILYKARKSTDYNKLDTIALKLQGGPFNTLHVDVMKYPEYIFHEDALDKYDFKFERSTRIDNQQIYVIRFDKKPYITQQLYKGQLFIDPERKILTSAIYELNITNKYEAAKLFVRKKPANARVWPTKVAYRVDYREKDGKWYYGYSNVLLEFKINWDKKLFNSVYSLSCEMAVTDWEKNLTQEMPKARERIKASIILEDEAVGFSDPDFWGEYNIIEPEKSIESAIKKIQRQLKRSNKNEGSTAP